MSNNYGGISLSLLSVPRSVWHSSDREIGGSN